MREDSLTTWDARASQEWQARARRISAVATGMVVVFTLLLALAVLSTWRAGGMAL